MFFGLTSEPIKGLRFTKHAQAGLCQQHPGPPAERLEVRVPVFFSVVYSSRGTLPDKSC